MNTRLVAVVAALATTVVAAGCASPTPPPTASSSTSVTAPLADAPVMIAPGPQSSSTPSTATAPAVDVAGAETVITRGLEVMFTWYPSTDRSSADAVGRAAAYLTAGMATTSTTGTRPSLQWSQWKTARATVIASARITSDEPDIADSPNLIRRVVSITQRVDTGTGAPQVQEPMTAWVTASMTRAGWRISAMHF